MGSMSDQPLGGATPAGGTAVAERPAEKLASQTPWVTIVWDDPVNLMSYVSFVFQQHFGYSREKSDALMLDVHQLGRAVVSNGTREEMERDVEAMHGYGLWATVKHDN